MHMADALISPTVGGVMWTATAVLIGYSSKKVKQEMDQSKVPLMGVAAAFIFAAQMINFTIPATGSSGHLGGGLIMAILLGPYAAFLAMASVLTVQALFFADGGLLALGCNIFNLGFFPCFIAYPLIFKTIAGLQPSRGKIITGSLIAAIVGLQLGAFAVVLETLFSGISSLPFGTFVLLMQPIHLGIGIVEGLATAAVVLFVWQARPEIIQAAAGSKPYGSFSTRNVLAGLAVATIVIGAIFSWFASGHPDGLEWSMFKTSGHEELETPGAEVYDKLAGLQERTAFLPDYGFKTAEQDEAQHEAEEAWPAVQAGTSVSGLIGSVLTLLLATLIAFVLKRRKTATAQITVRKP
ncbi:MAG: energy-coupling factor ABC transporter permease [Candidatus Alcyoniella australis]|nr:energy-coupling factor ABC transporter permease [Candidatus Alcyoniella australis]